MVFCNMLLRISWHTWLYSFSFRYSIMNSFVVFLRFFWTTFETFFRVIRNGFIVTWTSAHFVLNESST